MVNGEGSEDIGIKTTKLDKIKTFAWPVNRSLIP